MFHIGMIRSVSFLAAVLDIFRAMVARLYKTLRFCYYGNCSSQLHCPSCSHSSPVLDDPVHVLQPSYRGYHVSAARWCREDALSDNDAKDPFGYLSRSRSSTCMAVSAPNFPSATLEWQAAFSTMVQSAAQPNPSSS